MNHKLKVLVAGVAIFVVAGCNANESTKPTQTEVTDTLKTVELKSSTVEGKYMGLHTGMTLEEVTKYLLLNKLITDSVTAKSKKILTDSYKTSKLRKLTNDAFAKAGIKTIPILVMKPSDGKPSDEQILLYSMGVEGIESNALKEHKDFKNKEFEKLFLLFTDDKILWHITLLYRAPSGTLHNIALKKALKKRFAGHFIKQAKYGEHNFDYYWVTMIDNKVSDNAIEKYSQTYLNEL